MGREPPGVVCGMMQHVETRWLMRRKVLNEEETYMHHQLTKPHTPGGEGRGQRGLGGARR